MSVPLVLLPPPFIFLLLDACSQYVGALKGSRRVSPWLRQTFVIRSLTKPRREGVSSERMRTRSSPPYILMSLKIFSKMSHRKKKKSFIK
jgi:hypothetical protein